MRMRPSTFVSMTVASSSSDASQKGSRPRARPALLTRMSIPPSPATASSTKRRLLAASRTSSSSATSASIRSTRRAPPATLAPASRSARTVPAPKPLEAPVTIARLPSSPLTASESIRRRQSTMRPCVAHASAEPYPTRPARRLTLPEVSPAALSRAARLAAVGTALFLLLAVVAIASRGGFGHEGSSSTGTSYTSWAMSAFLVVFFAAMPFALYVFVLQQREALVRRQRKGFARRVVETLLILAAIAVALTFRTKLRGYLFASSVVHPAGSVHP